MQEMWRMWVRSLGREDPLEEGMATHSSILAWRVPWAEAPGGLDSLWGHNSRTQLSNQTTTTTVSWEKHDTLFKYNRHHQASSKCGLIHHRQQRTSTRALSFETVTAELHADKEIGAAAPPFFTDNIWPKNLENWMHVTTFWPILGQVPQFRSY